MIKSRRSGAGAIVFPVQTSCISLTSPHSYPSRRSPALLERRDLNMPEVTVSSAGYKRDWKSHRKARKWMSYDVPWRRYGWPPFASHGGPTSSQVVYHQKNSIQGKVGGAVLA
ncbi:uncharacterized protein LOC144009466 isoform X2 [Festucalex cinctus]